MKLVISQKRYISWNSLAFDYSLTVRIVSKYIFTFEYIIKTLLYVNTCKQLTKKYFWLNALWLVHQIHGYLFTEVI